MVRQLNSCTKDKKMTNKAVDELGSVPERTGLFLTGVGHVVRPF